MCAQMYVCHRVGEDTGEGVHRGKGHGRRISWNTEIQGRGMVVRECRNAREGETVWGMNVLVVMSACSPEELRNMK